MPGILYPPHCVRPTESKAEKTVHGLLQKHLPDGWVAWHSFRFACKPRGGAELREIDFLILVPDGGLIVVEVKGGSGWTFEDGFMRRYPGAAEVESPLDQAITAKNTLVTQLKKRLPYGAIPWVTHMVMFPEVAGYETPSGNGYENVTLMEGHMHYLADALQSFANRAFKQARAGHSSLREVLHAMWCERWVPSLRVADMRKVRSRELFELSASQRGLAQRLEVRGALLVTGGPGSGKTIVAREAAFRWAEEGRHVVYFCYTLALAREMRANGVPGAHAIREYMRACVASTDPSVADADTSTWDHARWDELVRRALAPETTMLDQPDVLIIDEAQDFGPDDWRFFDRLRHEHTAVLALGDVSQRFLSVAAIPRERFDVELGLEEQRRSPQPIAELAYAVRAGEDVWLERSEHLQLEAVQPGETRWDAICRAVERQRGIGFELHDQCVLSLASVGKMTRKPVEGAEDLRTVLADSEDAERALVMDTALRFKGLERPWVVITDLGETLDAAVRLRLFVALTRCTVGVTLVLTAAESACFAATAPVESVA